MIAYFTITNKCNMKCKMCDIGSGRSNKGLSLNWKSDKDFLRPKDWLQIVKKYCINHARLIGVEPLLYPQFDELVQMLSSVAKVSLTTNAWLFDKHEKAIVNNCKEVAVSIDGLEEIHDKIRGVDGAWRRAISAVEALKANKVKTRVSFAITPDNLHQIADFANFMHKKGLPVVFNHFNTIETESAKGYCVISPSTYTFENFDVDLLWSQVEKVIKTCSFFPKLTTRPEIQNYYKAPIRRFKRLAGCEIFNLLLSNKLMSIISNGDIIATDRCWLLNKIGNVNDGISEKMISQIKSLNCEFKLEGLPPPCQRLCCAGKCV